jgi:hypothetical protein
MGKEIILDWCGAPLSQATVDRLMAMAHMSDSDYNVCDLVMKNVFLNNIRLVVDHGDVIYSLVQHIRNLELAKAKP